MNQIKVNLNEYQEFRKKCLNILEVSEFVYGDVSIIHKFSKEVEREIHQIYNILTKGGIQTKSGDLYYLDLVHEYKINYKDKGDSMIGLKNVKMKVSGRQLYTTTYMMECEECGYKGIVSVKKEMIPKCHKCAGKAHVAPQITMSELVDSSSLINRNPEDKKEISFFNESEEDGFNVRVILDNAQAKTLEQVQGGVLLGEGIKRLYSLDAKAVDVNKTKTEKPTSASDTVTKVKKSVTKKSNSKITDDDLAFVLQQIRANFTGKSFKSRDLAPKVVEKLTARQLPSRLTQLVNKGILDADSSSPKNYTLKGE